MNYFKFIIPMMNSTETQPLAYPFHGRRKAVESLLRSLNSRGSRRPRYSEKAVAVGDPAVRSALHQMVLRDHWSDPETVVIDELAICHGYARVDIAVVNGELHGYEIKSQLDSVDRLAHQAHVYSATLDRVTLVTHEKHLSHAIELLPEWWGILQITHDEHGAIQFRTLRESQCNPSVDPGSLVEFLWKGEAQAALRAAGVPEGLSEGRKQQVYERVINSFSISELKALVRMNLKRRRGLPTAAPQT